MDLSPDEDNFPGRLLHQAALWDNVELLQELIASGADVNARDANWRCALHAAALAERSRCLEALCDAGADLDAHSDASTGGKTALHICAERGHVENVAALVRAGASLDAVDAAGNTPLALAERARHRHAANALRSARDALERERLSQHGQLRELVSRGECQPLKTKLASLGPTAGLVVNMTPNGANTLLYVACEAGLKACVGALLAAGADGRAHPVTKYGPLYIACYHGHADIVKLLLAHFPSAVQQETVERWLPLHAACIGGHASLVTLLLDYPYPEDVLSVHTSGDGSWSYQFPFDINASDVSGQSALYVACTLGNLPVLEALLACRVTPISDVTEEIVTSPQLISPRAGLSSGIHAIVSKLTGANRDSDSQTETRTRFLCPVDLESRRSGDSCVSCATRGGHSRLVARLLQAGARPDSPAADPRPLDARSNSPDSAERGWTALALAARARNLQIAEILLNAGATDPQGRALAECARHGLTDLLAAVLATRSHIDPENKLNRSGITAAVFAAGGQDLTFSALAPNTPVMLDWRDLRCRLAAVRTSWIKAAASRHAPTVYALHAVTRIDVANNELRTLPPDIFGMISLRYLNAAQNKLERLPSKEDPLEEEEPRGKKTRRSRKTRVALYSAPVLQELYLQDNRLEELPDELFSLPALATLDVSNNKIRELPATMWTAPALRDLNAALNHLRDLPQGRDGPPLNPECRQGSPVASPTGGNSRNSNPDTCQQWSRSSSVDSDAEDESPTLGDRTGNAVWSEVRSVHTWRSSASVDASDAQPSAQFGSASGSARGSALVSLNLSHNQFTCVPRVLACRAQRLARLNMAYNSLRSMSYVTSYPTSLRQLDLSHNEITCWPSLPQVDSFSSSEGDPLACYCPRTAGDTPVRSGRPRSCAGAASVRTQLLSAACPARRHLRLEGLRTLILSNNLLTRIQLTTDDDGHVADSTRDGNHSNTDTADEDDDWGNGWSSESGSGRRRLLFPLLSMLDVSCNLLRTIPSHIHELTNLSVLNISGNKDIAELPPQMGLLSRLWNLNTAGCSLAEPLRSMVASGRYKSMDIVGYLRSVLHEAKPYACLKLMLVGVQGIGKTSLLECLRQESAAHHRRRPTDHWTRRMGNRPARRGCNMSTVGVDIGEWVYEKRCGSRGPVTFRTWDFAGQREYYATHQYFLSRRSLYLVVWRVTDGRRGLSSAVQWLRSIQARAPGSPVVMVATHYDQATSASLNSDESPEALQRLIRSSVMAVPDADKLGLPRVLDSVEVSCTTRHNIRLLADVIYNVAFSVKPPGSKQALVEQLVPATYLALEECVTTLASELRDPVLRHEEYKRLVTQYMQQKNHRTFRDAAELQQATAFLHENGVLLHYDDATLKELYFVRPQWLCDVLAHVVTVREINPFASNGIMRLEELAHVFRASPQLGEEEGSSSLGALGVSLLNKFELALCWDARVLLVPPLLPAEPPATPQLPLRLRSPWQRRAWPSLPGAVSDTRGTDSPSLVEEATAGAVRVEGRRCGRTLRRVLAASYVPCGFWPRLVTRLLADDAVANAAPALYRLPQDMEVDEATRKALELNWAWKLWQTGVRLVCGDLTMLELREMPPERDPLVGGPLADDVYDDPFYGVRLRFSEEGGWSEVDPRRCACIRLLVPARACVARRDDGLPIAGYQSITLEPNPEVLAKILAIVSEHVDLLLEDWYPSLGTRFVHTSEGRCLITRVVPCCACLQDLERPPHHHNPLVQAVRRLEVGAGGGEAGQVGGGRVSQESRASDGDSGVDAESASSSRLGSVEGAPETAAQSWGTAHAWTVEECILAACTDRRLHCPHHPDVQLRDVAPDTLLLDVEEVKRARWDQISRSNVAGRGAFGTVLAGVWRPQGGETRRVALKALQPVAPPAHSDVSAIHAHKAALARWQREPRAAACRAYCALRQEYTILSRLRHAHVVNLVALCAAPLALLLELAPLGALDASLRQYRSCGKRVGVRATRALALQVARALEYLHAKRIVYRDLKSENVLVWSLPRPQDSASAERTSTPIDVLVKLGDYGISRLAPPSGTKGFGGTEGFMAPEVMRYNGEQEYNEKVDCFSYGMLLYEILSLRQPFEGHEAVKEAVLEGVRPPLTSRDVKYPCCMVEAMRRCWAGAPAQRPSAAALVSVAGAPEFTALSDAAFAALTPHAAVVSASADSELWLSAAERVQTLAATKTRFTHAHSLAAVSTVTAMCQVGRHVWLGHEDGAVSIYSVETCALQWRVRVQDSVGGSPSAVVALQVLHDLDRVALALQCGRLFLVRCTQPEAEGSFVQTELGTASELLALAAAGGPQGLELWAGGDSLDKYTVTAGGVCSAERLAERRVGLLAADPRLPLVFVHFEPGACVEQWRSGSAGCERIAQLDCSKLAPCSESLQSMTLDDGPDPERCNVTALRCWRGLLYVGTAWGCLVVVDAATLRPVTVLRPHVAGLCAVVPLTVDTLVTVGSGYRPLLQRFAPQQTAPAEHADGTYCLLWRADRWLPD